MPKTITGSVGRGGKNFPPSDVMTVQYLLNCVPATQGGPAKELAVDGAAGPKTIAAIEGFQRKLGGFADGRVDPGGATLRALQTRDPYPNQPMAQGGQAKQGQFPPGKSGGGTVGHKTAWPGQFPGKQGDGMVAPGNKMPGQGGTVMGGGGAPANKMPGQGGGTKNF